MDIDKQLEQTLIEQKARHLYRQRRIMQGPQGAEVTIDGKQFLAFCSNDYLSLANHPKIVAAFKQGADRYGMGSGASHLINGHCLAHHALEEELAEFVQRPRALLFSTGYMANLGITSALVGRRDGIFEDRINHASLLDAGLLGDSQFTRYKHRDADHLSQQLSKSKAHRKLVLSDGVFSMDGDLAPLPKLAEVAKANGAWLMIDDAHGFGIMGKQGRGSLEYFSMTSEDVPILMATLGKALGTFGAFVAGSQPLIETLIQQARTYIYTTALPPAMAEATRVSLQLVIQETWRREKLHALVQRFRQGATQLGLPIMDSFTPIQPILIGQAQQALTISAALEQRGILITAIRPPTVPPDTARLRVTLSAGHTTAHVDQLLDSLAHVWAKHMAVI